MTIKREKWLRGVYSFVILSVGAPIFVVANQLQNSYLLILTIGVLCLIVCCIPKNGYVCCFASNDRLFVLYFPSKTFSILWILQFFRQLQRNSSIYPKVNFIICQKRQLFSHNVADLFIYYIDRGLRLLVRTLSFFDGLLHDAYRFSEKDLLYEMIAVVTVLFVYLAARQFFSIRLLSRNTRFQSLTTVLLICFLTFSAILPLYLPKVHQSLEETSELIREYLNDEGLYDTLHEYQLTGSARTGFSENDEQLGGPLYDNGEVVLQRTKKEMAIGRSKIKIITPVLDE